MTGKCTAQLLADLGLTQSLSRPRVSNDNPYSEAQFKTVKYHPGFPGRFGSIEEAKVFCREFFRWYNTEHRHSGIAMLTPDQVPLRRGAEGDRPQARCPGRGQCRPPPSASWPARPRPERSPNKSGSTHYSRSAEFIHGSEEQAAADDPDGKEAH